MPLTAKHLDDLERLPTLLGPLMPLAGLANPAIATMTFAYGMLLRVVRIGSRVREEIEAKRQSLSSEVKAAGLFRVPITVDVQAAELRAFVGLGRRRFPNALRQLEDDVRIMDEPLHPDRVGARERLAIAMRVIPRVYDRFELTGSLRLDDDPLLSADHLHLLNPGEPMVYRALVANLHLERQTLLTGESSSLSLLRARLPDYVLAQLQVDRDALDAARARALDAATTTVREIYWEAVFGDGSQGGAARATVTFLVNRSLERIGDELDALGAERDRLRALPEDQRDDARLQAIDDRERELRELERHVLEAKES